jgi:molecular chaperone DnaK (HSP70)
MGANLDRSFMKQAREAQRGRYAADDLLHTLETMVEDGIDAGPEEDIAFWEEVLATIEKARQGRQYFKDPEVLAYISELQDVLVATGIDNSYPGCGAESMG